MLRDCRMLPNDITISDEYVKRLLDNTFLEDPEAIQTATTQLLQCFKKYPEQTSISMCSLLVGCHEERIRQSCAVFLKSWIGKYWTKQSKQVQNCVREACLKTLNSDQSKVVVKATCLLLGSFCHHELLLNNWPELFPFLKEALEGPLEKQEMGCILLSNGITVNAVEGLQPHFATLFPIFDQLLDIRSSPFIPYHVILTLSNCIFIMGDSERKFCQPLIPKILQIIRLFLVQDQDKACECMNIFDEFLDSEVGFLAPYVKDVIQLWLEIIMDSGQFEESTKIQALNYIVTVIQTKKKVINKHKLLGDIVKIVYPCLLVLPDDDDDDENSLSAAASQVIDSLGNQLSSKQVFDEVAIYFRESFHRSEDCHLRAGLLSIAVLSEGCSEYICRNHIAMLVDKVCELLCHPSLVVRNAALMAIGQFAEYLQPDINSYHAKVVPLLLEFINATVNMEGVSDKSLTKSFFALQSFVENLDDEIQLYLAQVMELLVFLYKSAKSKSLQELSLSAIGSLASAGKEHFKPYFSVCMELIKPILDKPMLADEDVDLRVQAIDTLGVFSRTMESSEFYPLVGDCMKLGIETVKSSQDPDLQRVVYGLFGGICIAIKEEISPFIAIILEMLHTTLEAEFDLGKQVNDLEEEDLTTLSDDGSSDEFQINNSFFDAQIDACDTIGEIASNAPVSFFPYVKKFIEKFTELSEHFHAGIRKAAISAISEIACSMTTNSSSGDNSISDGVLQHTMKLFLATAMKDKEAVVVVEVFEALVQLCKEWPVNRGVEVFSKDIVSIVMMTLENKLQCQLCEFDSGQASTSDDESEYDTILLEKCCEIIPSVIKFLSPEEFKTYFPYFLPFFVIKSKKDSDNERSFAFATMAEIAANMGTAVSDSLSEFYTFFMRGICDKECSESRGNSCYGMGILAENVKEALFPHYPAIMKKLSDIIACGESDPHCIDNLCACVCRMVCIGGDRLPLEQIVPVLFSCLPLKKDFDELETVYKFFNYILDSKHELACQNIEKIVSVITHDLLNKDVEEESVESMCRLVGPALTGTYRGMVEQQLMKCSPDVIELFRKRFFSQ